MASSPYMLPKVLKLILANWFNQKVNSTLRQAFKHYTHGIIGWHHCTKITNHRSYNCCTGNKTKSNVLLYAWTYWKYYLLITGMVLWVLWLMILHNRPIPDQPGITTSVKTRSIWFVWSCKTLQASRPFATAVTVRELVNIRKNIKKLLF